MDLVSYLFILKSLDLGIVLDVGKYGWKDIFTVFK